MSAGGAETHRRLALRDEHERLPDYERGRDDEACGDDAQGSHRTPVQKGRLASERIAAVLCQAGGCHSRIGFTSIASGERVGWISHPN